MKTAMKTTEHYISAVSQVSGLNMPAERQARHTEEFHRLLGEANAVCALMGDDTHLAVTPITVLRHDERSAAVAVCTRGEHA